VQLNNKDTTSNYNTDTEEDIVEIPGENNQAFRSGDKESGSSVRASSTVICDDDDLYGECDELIYIAENNKNNLELNHNNATEQYDGQTYHERLVAFTQNETEVCLKARQKVLAWSGVSIPIVTS